MLPAPQNNPTNLAVAATSKFRLQFLRGLYAEAARLNLGLEAALNESISEHYQSTRTGKVVSATAAAGRSVQFSQPAANGASPADIAELASDLLDLFEECDSALISAGIAAPTDAQIFAEMKVRLKPVTESFSDFSGLRMGHGTPVAITSA